MYKTKLKWHPQIIKISYSIFCPIPKGEGVNRKISFRLVYKTEYTHNHLFICIYRNYLSVCPPIVPFPTPHYPIPLLPPPMCSSVTMSLHTQSLMSLCHYVFISVKYFYHLTILSVSCECRVGQYLPFLSRTFRDEFVSINKTIVYKIKQRRQISENRKFIY